MGFLRPASSRPYKPWFEIQSSARLLKIGRFTIRQRLFPNHNRA
jgi:hypothetical protein